MEDISGGFQVSPRSYAFSLAMHCPYEEKNLCRDSCPVQKLRLQFQSTSSRMNYIANHLSNKEVVAMLNSHLDHALEVDPDNSHELNLLRQNINAAQ